MVPTLKKEHKSQTFENKRHRKVLEPKQNEGSGKFRILHNEEVHNLNRTPIIVIRIINRKL
jgi:hypothetical protein